MSTQVLGTSIRTDVQTKLSVAAFTANTDTTLTMINDMICQSAESLAAMIRASEFGDDFLVTNDAVALNSTQGTIDTTTLTDPFVGLRKVAWIKNMSESPVPLERASIDQTYMGGLNPRTWTDVMPRYRLVKDNIVFYPPPASIVTVLVTYDTDIGLLSDLSNTVTLYAGWKEWIVLDVCRKVAQRENDMQASKFYSSERDEVWTMIVNSNTNRDGWTWKPITDLWNDDGSDTDWRGR